MKKLTSSSIYDTYWKFATKRQDIFFKRLKKESSPWTDDPILKKYKFTNAYRASDRVSQFLIKNVIYSDKIFSPEDTIFRILLFKSFNKIETWKYLEENLGEISYKNYTFDRYDSLLSSLLLDKKAIYSAAYIMPSGVTAFHNTRKHKNHLMLLEYMMRDNIAKKIAQNASLEDLYKTLLDYPTIGSFLAFQYAIDINYSTLTDFDEMSFVVAGPGAKRGIQKCFLNSESYSEEYIIRKMAEIQSNEFERLGLSFQSLWGRPLQLIDCQNLFCEVDKYSRVAFPNIAGITGKRIKQLFEPNHKQNITYYYPPKWGINTKKDTNLL